MAWFKRVKEGLTTNSKKDIPEGLWIKCEGCSENYLQARDRPEYRRLHQVRGTHFKITSEDYIGFLLDEESFQETDADLTTADPLKFKDLKKYSDRIKSAVKKTGLKEAVRSGYGRMNDIPVIICIMDFSFIGGSMGSVVGEKIKRAIDRAIETGFPLIVISATGGARMMEGILSLMQMAKTSARGLRNSTGNRGLFISVLTNPTTAGVMASYAMLGDVIIAEPNALDRLSQGRGSSSRRSAKTSPRGSSDRNSCSKRDSSTRSSPGMNSKIHSSP